MGRNLIVEFRNGIYFAYAITSVDIQGFYFTLEAGDIDYAAFMAARALTHVGNRRVDQGWDVFSGPEQ